MEQLTVVKAATACDAESANFLGLLERHMWANSTITDVTEKVIFLRVLEQSMHFLAQYTFALRSPNFPKGHPRNPGEHAMGKFGGD